MAETPAWIATTGPWPKAAATSTAEKVATISRSGGMFPGNSCNTASPTRMPTPTPSISATAWRPWLGRPGARQTIAETAAKAG